jgi:hypothetical protein
VPTKRPGLPRGARRYHGACRARRSPADLRLPVRSRVEAFKGSGVWEEVRLDESLPIPQTAILICDMWDRHWCSGATRRVAALAGRMAPVIDAARARGIQIIHAPSETMEFYKDWPQRQRHPAHRENRSRRRRWA